jgi:hypothetical protein
MANTPATKAAGNKSGAFRDYEDWFTQTPDPWAEIATLQPGGDRTFASTVRRMVTSAEPAQRPAMEAKLLAVLARPSITDTGRMFVCRMLALIGTDQSVAPLAGLLANATTADAARYALETISGEAATAALRHGLGQLTGIGKVGVIGAIALRGDVDARPMLEQIATNGGEISDVRAAAARGVARLSVNRT